MLIKQLRENQNFAVNIALFSIIIEFETLQCLTNILLLTSAS